MRAHLRFWRFLTSLWVILALLLLYPPGAVAQEQPTDKPIIAGASESLGGEPTSTGALSPVEFSLDSSGIDIGCDESPSAGGWACIDTSQDIEVPTAASQSPAALAKSYNWRFERTVYYGIGSNEIGHFKWRMSVNFNGRQGQINQSTQKLSGPNLRSDFRVNAYLVPCGGCTHEFRDGVRVIRPSAPNFGSYPKMPEWKPYFHGTRYDLHYGLRWRAKGVSNPNSSNGTFGTATKESRAFRCVDSTGSCYFP